MNDAALEQSILTACEVVRQGGLIAFPTDTVYGLAARVDDEIAIGRLFTAKGRDSMKAIAVLLADLVQLPLVAPPLNPVAQRLAQRFLPGALTLVVPRNPDLPAALSPYPTIGVRIPNHPVALAILQSCGPLAVTSANLAGQADCLTAEQVRQSLGARVDWIVDGGATPDANPSTVVDCTRLPVTILRAGPISAAQIEETAGEYTQHG
ncbi:MAG TPA: L-threonylcarbamoyladenylate synthase [Anaerolineales bacterium]|nr:L-threonylcarbamoyladenylate synthase [Anaerolineales bacterium]